MEITPPHQTEEATSTRPTAITVVCIIGFVGAILTVPMIFTDIAHKIGAWYPPFLAFSSLYGLICFIGLWMMRRWALFAYTALCVINQIVMLVMGSWNVFAILLPGIVIAIGFKYLTRMR